MPQAVDPKTAIVHVLGQHFRVEKLAGQSLFQVNALATAYVRFSKDLGGGKFYFGVGEKDSKRFLDQNLYVLFICGNIEDVLVLPGEELLRLLESAPVSHGQWKLNIFCENGRFILRVPRVGKFDITEFRNHFDFTPKSCRRMAWPVIQEHIPLTKQKRPEPIRETLPPLSADVDLSSRLRITSRDSTNPKAFEEALSDYFGALGFKCRQIGGPGETDVLIEEPFTIVVDGKTTRAPSVSHINFTRIKQHKAAHAASAMLVVAVGFQPAVVRDALVEDAGLITVETLTKVLSMHERLPLSPLILTQVFTTRGLIDRQSIQPLEEGFARLQRWLQRVFLVIDSEDFEWRSLHEMKGRLDLVCEQLGQEKFALEDLRKTLDLLSDAPFDVLESQDAEYRSIYYPDQAKMKVLHLFRQSQPSGAIELQK